jgi:uncharacterized protein YacL
MGFSIEFAFRIMGAIVLAIGGGMLGNNLAGILDAESETYSVVLGLVGALAGLIITPYITVRPLRRMRKSLSSMPSGRLTAIIGGTFLGLGAAALLAQSLSFLPSPFGEIAPLAAAAVFTYLSIVVLAARQSDLQGFFNIIRPTFQVAGAEEEQEENFILLDTSVIIDGRIADISKTGFIRSTLLIPNFVLMELQHIADSADALRRNRGRRGLEVLSIMQNDSPIPVRITDLDESELRDVDSKLVVLARHLHCPIMTNDYNLNRVAELQGVTVLNINDLANAVKAAFLPGEELEVKIIQDGKEAGQGVGYLDDGTMVVVEGGNRLIDRTLAVTVTKVLQTTAGRMIFARP